MHVYIDLGLPLGILIGVPSGVILHILYRFTRRRK